MHYGKERGVIMFKPKHLLVTIILLAALLLGANIFARPAALAGPLAPNLGTTESFAVLAGETVTNIGDTIISGDLGVYPGTAVTGFPPGIVTGTGTIHTADAVALQAKND